MDNMYKDANSRLGILCKIKTAARIYNTMIRLYLEYIDFVLRIESENYDDKLENKAHHRILY